MASPPSTEYPTAGGLIFNRPASPLSEKPLSGRLVPENTPGFGMLMQVSVTPDAVKAPEKDWPSLFARDFAPSGHEVFFRNHYA
jgi:hypothetical protein